MLPMRVVDLFAGLGGFTCGALEAGAEVVLVVDSDPAPLKVLGANAPTATAVVATLGEGRDEVDLPPPAPDLHVHFSTPCTELSVARRDDKANIDAGLSMIRWAVGLVLERSDHSWSARRARLATPGAAARRRPARAERARRPPGLRRGRRGAAAPSRRAARRRARRA